MHSSQFTSAAIKYTGKKVVVVGAGVSAHDIAQDIAHHCGDVTMVQRSETYVISDVSGPTVIGTTLQRREGKYLILSLDG